jgi:hypothetical protein
MKFHTSNDEAAKIASVISSPAGSFDERLSGLRVLAYAYERQPAQGNAIKN